MRVAGIIGGIGPESTIEYYRLIIADWRQRRNDGNYPAVIINSIDLTRIRLADRSVVFDEIRRRSPIPLVSTVEATCDDVHSCD